MTALSLLGVRHHGPGSARSAVAVLERLQPDLVCIEGPPEAQEILPLAEDAAMEPPVALLAYDLDRPERAAFWPLATFSPEWQALRWAQRHHCPVRFIDVPAALMLREHGRRDEQEMPADPIGELAAAAGYDDPERWWDDLVEHRGTDVFDAIAEAMASVREGRAPSSEDARREVYMRSCLRAARVDGFERVAVVCGAWHVPALADLDADSPAEPVESGRTSRRGRLTSDVAMTWIPWTSRRLAAASGYGAGVRAPGWYHHLFHHAGPNVIARWFCEVAAVLRRGGYVASPAQVIDATRLAEALATLRRRPLAGLSEVTEAAAAVLGEGGMAPMTLVHDELVIGTQIGSVPDTTPMVPLARDLVAWQRRLRLRPEPNERLLELDLRRPNQLARSRLFHRLTLLEVPWAVEAEGRGSAGTFRETWRLRWEPELAVRLVERSAYGTTVEAAASAYVVQGAHAADTLADLTRAVEGCLLADLPAALEELVVVVADRAAVHADVAQLMDALGPLARSRRYGDVRGTESAMLDAVIEGMVVRIAAGLRPACSGLAGDEATAMAGRLQAAQSAVALLTDSSHADTWHDALMTVVEAPTVPGVVRGRVCRLLLDARWLEADGAGRRLSRALSSGTPTAEGAAFVEGFLAGSGTVLVHDQTLLALVDEWLSALPPDSFITCLPLLRRTFSTFEPSERRLIGELVARESAGARPASADGTLDAERVALAVATMAELLGVQR
jgi:Family of unknown function (DUF5682)